MNKPTFKEIHEAINNLKAGSIVSFNGIPMVVEEQTNTLKRYFGQFRWEKQCDGELDVDVTLQVQIKHSANEYIALKAENERLTKLFAATERLMLMDGEFEAYSVGTLERANAKLERLIEAGDALADAMVSEYGQRECKKIPEYIKWQMAREVQS